MKQPISNISIARAKSKSPDGIWRELGFVVKKSGSELRVYGQDGTCLYRSVPIDGKWLSTMAEAGVAIAPGVGDNISLVKYFTGCDFREAVKKINSTKADLENAAPMSEKHEDSPQFPVVIPGGEKAQKFGREYLSMRKIPLSVVEHAEESGFLWYMDRTNMYASALLFKGYDQDNNTAFASKRLTEAGKHMDTGTKRDLAGSSKVHVPVLPGNKDVVFITEGGVNALSIQALHQLYGHGEPPTVIMTAGIGNRHFLESPKFLTILKEAKVIYIAREHDVHISADKRASLNLLAEKLKKQIEDVSDATCSLVYPPEIFNINDVNDFLVSGVPHKEAHDIVAAIVNNAITEDEGQSPAV